MYMYLKQSSKALQYSMNNLGRKFWKLITQTFGVQIPSIKLSARFEISFVFSLFGLLVFCM